jgi:hypothetical protein
MEMIGVSGVGARPEHGREVGAGLRADGRLEQRLGCLGRVLADLHGLALLEFEAADVDCVGKGVLAELAGRLPVAIAAPDAWRLPEARLPSPIAPGLLPPGRPSSPGRQDRGRPAGAKPSTDGWRRTPHFRSRPGARSARPGSSGAPGKRSRRQRRRPEPGEVRRVAVRGRSAAAAGPPRRPQPRGRSDWTAGAGAAAPVRPRRHRLRAPARG